MEHKIINNGQYLLVVSDDEIKEGDWILDTTDNSIWDCYKDMPKNIFSECKKIIAHLPLNSTFLQGVDLLPEYEQVETDNRHFFSDVEEYAYIDGYKKAKEKFCYTKNDIINAISYGIDLEAGFVKFEYKKYPDSYTQYLESISKKIPIAFETEDLGVEIIKNKQGQTVWVGEYIY